MCAKLEKVILHERDLIGQREARFLTQTLRIREKGNGDGSEQQWTLGEETFKKKLSVYSILIIKCYKIRNGGYQRAGAI